MLQELQANRLSVLKIPTYPDGYIRAPVSQNCMWYRELCSRHLTSRKRYPKPRTYIRRRETIRALHRMMRGDRTSVYARRILEVIEWLGAPL